MMKALARWVLARRINALVSTSGFAVLGLIFPPVLLLGLASLALVTLRRGPKEGLLIVLGSAGLMMGLSLLDSHDVWIDVIIFSTLWFLTWLVAQVYRELAATAWMVNATGAIGILLVSGFYLLLGEPAEFWLGLLNEHLRPVLIQASFVQNETDLNQLLTGVSQVMTGGIVALFCLLVIVSLLLARWWQAMLYNPGGFRKEFHSLRLGRVTAWVMLMLLAASLTGQFALTTDLTTVVWLLFLFQGLAVIHHLVVHVGLNVGWLFGIYFLLAIMPYYASPVLSGLGFIDTWFDFRGRVQRRGQAKKDSIDEDRNNEE